MTFSRHVYLYQEKSHNEEHLTIFHFDLKWPFYFGFLSPYLPGIESMESEKLNMSLGVNSC